MMSSFTFSALKYPILLALLSFAGAQAATHIWQGPANGNWSAAANWNGGVPTTGELGGTIVQFGSNTTSNQDLAGLTIDQIHFMGTGNTINGTTALMLSGSTLTVNMQDDAGGNLLSSSLALILKNAAIEAAVTTGTLTIAGNMSGSVGFIHSGPATLMLTSASNTYTGLTSVTNGTLILNSNGLDSASRVTLSARTILRIFSCTFIRPSLR